MNESCLNRPVEETMTRAHRAAFTVLLSEARRLQEGHLPVGVQILLVATQDDDDVGARQGPRVRQPVGEGVVRLSASSCTQRRTDHK